MSCRSEYEERGQGKLSPEIEMKLIEVAKRIANLAVAPLEGRSLEFDVALEMATPNVAARILPILRAQRLAGREEIDAEDAGKWHTEFGTVWREFQEEIASLRAQVEKLTREVLGAKAEAASAEDAWDRVETLTRERDEAAQLITVLSENVTRLMRERDEALANIEKIKRMFLQ